MSNGNDTKELAVVPEGGTLTAAVMEGALLGGDLERLQPAQRIDYMLATCKTLGLNPLTKPFEFIRLNGKMVMYARKDATEQLRKLNGISVTIAAREVVDDVYVVTAQARDKHGRTDESIGAVPIKGLQGEAKANALMKAETKAKRRVTLSISGLGMLDESETDGVPGAQVVDMGYIPPPETQAKLAAVSAASREASKGYADGSARAHREAPGHGPKAPPAPSAVSSTSPNSTASGPAPSATAPASAAAAPAASTAPSTAATSTAAATSSDLPKGATRSSGGAERAAVSGAIGSPPTGVSAASSPASSGDLPKEPTAPSATSPSSTPSGAQDVPPPSEREPGSDDDVEVANGDLVTCRHFGRDGRVIRETTEPRRSEEQHKKMFSLFRSRGISEQDYPDPKNPLVNKDGWRTRIKKRFGKDSTKDLSVRECSFLIDQMERWNSRHGDASAKEQKYRENGFEKRQDGSWGDGGAA